MTAPLAHFLECFDAYEAARAHLRSIPEDAVAESRQWLDHCISLWQRTVEARAAVVTSVGREG
jgi:hypothetical protein